MSFFHKILGAALVGQFSLSLAQETPEKTITPDHAAIFDAVPDDAFVRPRKRMKIFLVIKGNGEKHAESTAWGTELFAAIYRKTNAYAVITSQTGEKLEESGGESMRSGLAFFDGLILMNVTGDPFVIKEVHRAHLEREAEKDKLPYEPREIVLEAVRNGMGIILIHATAEGLPAVPAFADLRGAKAATEHWQSPQPLALLTGSPDHPITRAAKLPARFNVSDQIYRFPVPGPSDRRQILLSADTGKADGPLPVSWAHTYGKGRVFHTSLGHDKSVFADPNVAKHLLAASQWVAGDLDPKPGK